LFVLSKKLGEGAHAQVYKCYKITDFKKETPYAVKITREDDEEKR
jgi:RIO-like serine/threonine protein kinase